MEPILFIEVLALPIAWANSCFPLLHVATYPFLIATLLANSASDSPPMNLSSIKSSSKSKNSNSSPPLARAPSPVKDLAISLNCSNYSLAWLNLEIPSVILSYMPAGSPGIFNLDMVPSGNIPLIWLKIANPSLTASVRTLMISTLNYSGIGYMASQSHFA